MLVTVPGDGSGRRRLINNGMSMKQKTVLIGLLVALAACSGGDKEAAAPAASVGQTVANALATGDAADIKADMTQLDAAMMAFTPEAGALNEAFVAANQHQDEAKGKAIMGQIKGITERMNRDLLNMACESEEINDVRHRMIEANKQSIQLYDLVMKETRTEADVQQMTALSEQVNALQTTIGQTLLALGQTYAD